MESKTPDNAEEPVPFRTHESDMARMERSNRRLTIALAIVSVAAVLVIALCVCLLYRNNIKWVDAWMSYDYESEKISIDGENCGNARYVGDYSNYAEGDGDIIYGENYSQKKEAN